MIIPTAKIPSTPHNRPRASAQPPPIKRATHRIASTKLLIANFAMNLLYISILHWTFFIINYPVIAPRCHPFIPEGEFYSNIPLFSKEGWPKAGVFPILPFLNPAVAEKQPREGQRRQASCSTTRNAWIRSAGENLLL